MVVLYGSATVIRCKGLIAAAGGQASSERKCVVLPVSASADESRVMGLVAEMGEWTSKKLKGVVLLLDALISGCHRHQLGG
jgi:hypothetical protein